MTRPSTTFSWPPTGLQAGRATPHTALTARGSSPITMVCAALGRRVPEVGVDWLAAYPWHWGAVRLPAQQQRLCMCGWPSPCMLTQSAAAQIRSCATCSASGCGQQWSWQLRRRALGCTERCRSSRQHRSSHCAVLVVLVCLRVLYTCVVGSLQSSLGSGDTPLGHCSRCRVAALISICYNIKLDR